MLRIALTGGIGCGKSAVTDHLRALGATVLDADEFSHQVTAKGGEVLERIQVGQGAYACMIGGTDTPLLFVMTSPSSSPAECRALRGARVETAPVSVAGAGYP